MGIGLAIARKITQHYHMTIQYKYRDHEHQLIVSFPSTK